jgi:DNA-nicking Smr family endonuclease
VVNVFVCFTLNSRAERDRPVKRRPPISDDDRALFRNAVKGAHPIACDQAPRPGRKPRPIPLQSQADDRQVVNDLLADPIDTADVETGEELLFARPGLQHTVLRKLRRGQYRLDAELDLHGLTAAEARQALAAFLTDCRRHGARNVRIIHGKGLGSFNREPVLKAKVAHWLRQRDEVLAYCSARPVDGGTGAVYALLRGPSR